MSKEKDKDIESRIDSDSGYAIAYAIIQVAAALNSIYDTLAQTLQEDDD
jgi:hypothetical protein